MSSVGYCSWFLSSLKHKQSQIKPFFFHLLEQRGLIDFKSNTFDIDYKTAFAPRRFSLINEWNEYETQFDSTFKNQVMNQPIVDTNER